jgi:ubiquinone/menaquinone biosynthesis C-methylase UbiE
MHAIHCVSHWTNLAMKELSSLPVIAKIENLLQSLYSYFARSPKRHLEFTKLAAVMETKGLKIIRNIKTRCGNPNLVFFPLNPKIVPKPEV